MAQTFIYIAQQSLECAGRHYEHGDRFIASPFEGGPLVRDKLAIVASQDEQRAHGAQQASYVGADISNAPDQAAMVTVAPRRRGRPRKVLADGETPTRTYRRRDLEAEK